MAIELTEYSWPAKTLKSGIGDGIEIPAGEYLQIRHGALGDPAVDLQERRSACCPRTSQLGIAGPL